MVVREVISDGIGMCFRYMGIVGGVYNAVGEEEYNSVGVLASGALYIFGSVLSRLYDERILAPKNAEDASNKLVSRRSSSPNHRVLEMHVEE